MLFAVESVIVPELFKNISVLIVLNDKLQCHCLIFLIIVVKNISDINLSKGLVTLLYSVLIEDIVN
jgi:hypothetical protein